MCHLSVAVYAITESFCEKPANIYIATTSPSRCVSVDAQARGLIKGQQRQQKNADRLGRTEYLLGRGDRRQGRRACVSRPSWSPSNLDTANLDTTFFLVNMKGSRRNQRAPSWQLAASRFASHGLFHYCSLRRPERA